jgi:hypothetical protein
MLTIEGWGGPSCVQNVVEKIGKIIEKLGTLVELQAKHPPLGQNMIKFGHNGPQISCHRACWRGYDGANASRWNLEVEPFIVR